MYESNSSDKYLKQCLNNCYSNTSVTQTENWFVTCWWECGGPPWGVVGGLMVPLILIAIVILMIRRELQKVTPVLLLLEDEDASQTGCEQEVTTDEFIVVNEHAPPENQSRRIEVSNLLDYVCERLTNEHPFQEEFEKLPTGLIHPHEEAHKTENIGRSRYKGIVPYDHARVVLRSEESEDDTDFINASYIDGEFIAAQGPTTSTITEFWRMIWQEKCSRIIMLTNLHEWGVKKVEQYWPDSGEVQYGDLKICIENIQHFSNTLVRTLRITMGKESREVLHFLFRDWPDHDVPRETATILLFRFQVYSISRQASGPIVVHCSAGVGRTGTFIALDRLLTRSKRDRYLNVFSCVQNLRNRRPQMVQTVNQYIFLHRALLDGVMCEDSIMEDKEFVAVCDRISRSSHDYENLNRVNQQYEKLEALKRLNDEQICKEATTPENIDKNRDPDCLPDWRYQVYLSPVNGINNYINAVMFPGYGKTRMFIATQMPLSDTVHDFWRMIEEHDCTTILTLEPIDDFEIYWPELDETLDMGYFDVKQTEQQAFDTMIQRTFSLVYKNRVNIGNKGNEYKLVKQFCFTKWPYEQRIPSTYIDLLLLMEAVTDWTGRPSLSTTILQCRNGAERCGLYCVCWTVLERLRMEKIVSLMLTVKELRRIRSKVINSLDQYRFCEDFIRQFINGFHDYSNFQFTPPSKQD